MSEPTSSATPSDDAVNVERYQLALVERLGLAPRVLGESGLSVVPDPERADSALALCYQLAAHTVLWCDPAVESGLQDFVDASHANPDNPVSPDTFVAWATDRGLECVGSGFMKVRSADPAGPMLTADPRVVALDRDVPADLERMLGFLATCDEDDLDEADIETDALDPVIRCALAGDGPELAAFASALPFDIAPHWWDIGVLSHPGHRRQGLGVACVRSLIAGIEAAGGEPVYRHDPENVGSAAVASALGFVEAVHLRAVRLT